MMFSKLATRLQASGWGVHGDEALMRAQLQAYRRQMPLLYFILCVNSAASAWLYYGTAPDWLAVYLPGALITVCLARLATWSLGDVERITPEQARRRLSRVIGLGLILCPLYLSWGLTLASYGDAWMQSGSFFFMGLTGLGCVICLMHLRSAAVAITAVFITAVATALALRGEPATWAMALNMTLVGGVILYMALRHSGDFAAMVAANIRAQRLNEENNRLAFCDPLTGLANRRRFFTQLAETIDRAGEENRCFALALIDLDGFKPVNDLYGHATGDRLLEEIGRRLNNLDEAQEMFCARLGGDEFAMIRFGRPEDLPAFGAEIIETIATPCELPGVSTRVSASVGFAVYPTDATSAEVLFESADFALYHGKRTRGGAPVLFTEELGAHMREHVLLEQRMRDCDMEREFTLQFQPLYETGRGLPVAFEALARWTTPDGKSIPPNVFIEIAERSEVINRLTLVLLKKALCAAATWPPSVRLSFNLSCNDILSSEAVVKIIALIRSSRVAPERIVLEVTETAVMTDFVRAQQAIVAFRNLGVSVALDDFGTGYSSLAYVHKLPFDKIKIDRSFVQEIQTHPGARDIVRTVVDLCRNLSLQCVPEGVETADQARVLGELGCTTMQGYYFGRPMGQRDVEALLGMARSARI